MIKVLFIVQGQSFSAFYCFLDHLLFYNFICSFFNCSLSMICGSIYNFYQGRMNLYNNLPEYGKELLRSIDPTRQLDRLQCNICLHFFNFELKKPILLCKNTICAYQHGICSQCVQDMRKKRFENGIRDEDQPFRCPFCKEFGRERQQYDTSRFELIEKLSKVIQTLTEISNTAKQLTQQQTQKKLKEIVQRAEKDIFNITIESKRKSFLLKRLQERIKSTHQESQTALREVSNRENDLLKREQTFKLMMEDIMKHQRDLQARNQEKDKEIAALKEERRVLMQRLAEFEELHSLEQRTVNRANQLERRPDMFYNEDYYFNQFKFKPRKDDSFLENFKESRVQHIIQLKEGRESYFHTMGEKKTIFHSYFFNASKEQDKLICFTIKSHNKDVTRFKFGLADQNYKEIKNASLSHYFDRQGLSSHSDNKPELIMFYVNLFKMKLFATSSTLPKSQPLPKDLKLTKFTVFVYFVDLKTQLTFD